MVKFPIVSLISLSFTLMTGSTDGFVALHIPGWGAAAYTNVREDTAAGVTLTTFAAFSTGNQSNGNPADIVAYGLENQAGSVLFAVDPPSGNLSLAPGSVLDYETTHTYELTVTARDNAFPVASATGTMTVRVMDVNDNAPVFHQPLYRKVLPSTSPAGVLVGVYAANDADGSNPNNEIANYSIVSGDDTPPKFSMNPTTGEIRTSGVAFNTAVKASYDLAVRAVDGGTPALTGNALVEICLDESCPSGNVLFLRPGRGAAGFAYVAENAPPSSSVFTLLAESTGYQADGSDAVIEAYGIVNQPTPAVFQVDPQSGLIGLTTDASLDYESLPSHQYEVVVTARDNVGGGGVASGTSTLTVRVSDVNDNSPQFRQESYTATVAASAGLGESVGTFTADDNDGTDPNNVISAYSIVSGDDIPAKFAMNITTGEITTTGVPFNKAVKPSYTLMLQAEDGGTPSLTGDALVQICLDAPCSGTGSGGNTLVPYTLVFVFGTITASLL